MLLRLPGLQAFFNNSTFLWFLFAPVVPQRIVVAAGYFLRCSLFELLCCPCSVLCTCSALEPLHFERKIKSFAKCANTMENYKGNWEHNLFMFHHAAHFHDTKLYWNIPSCTRGIEFNFPADSMERRGFYAASHRESKVEFSLILVLQPIYFPCFR